MGKRGRGKDFRRNKPKKGRTDNSGGDDRREENFSDWVYENESFATYYKVSGAFQIPPWHRKRRAHHSDSIARPRESSTMPSGRRS